MPRAGVTFKQLLLEHGGGFGDERNIKLGGGDKSTAHFPQVQGIVPPLLLLLLLLLLACQTISHIHTYTHTNMHPPDKHTNLQLRRDCDIPYNDMLFFDDCKRTDHCAMVARECKGVVAQHTPQVSQSVAQSVMNALTHSLTHSLTCSFTYYSLTHSLTHSRTHACTHAFTP